MQFDNQGKMIITDGPKLGGSKHDTEHYHSDDEENLELKTGSKRRRVSKLETVKLARKADKDAASKKQKAKKERNAPSIGKAYKSKKSGGDVRKKGRSMTLMRTSLSVQRITPKKTGRMLLAI